MLLTSENLRKFFDGWVWWFAFSFKTSIFQHMIHYPFIRIPMHSAFLQVNFFFESKCWRFVIMSIYFKGFSKLILKALNHWWQHYQLNCFELVWRKILKLHSWLEIATNFWTWSFLCNFLWRLYFLKVFFLIRAQILHLLNHFINYNTQTLPLIPLKRLTFEVKSISIDMKEKIDKKFNDDKRGGF